MVRRNQSRMKLTQGDTEKNFFEQNPHWRYLNSSQKLLKTFGEELTSKLRWAIFLVEDPDSPYHRFLKQKRVELINTNYLKDDYTILFDPEKLEIINEDIKYTLDSYPEETMSKLKSDYYEREKSYQMLVQMERDSVDLKLKADVQTKLAKIYDELRKSREAFESENEEEKAKTSGKQQPGLLFRKG